MTSTAPIDIPASSPRPASRSDELGSASVPRFGSFRSPARPSLRGRSISSTSGFIASTPVRERRHDPNWSLVFDQMRTNTASAVARESYFGAAANDDTRSIADSVANIDALSVTSPLEEYPEFIPENNDAYDSDDTSSTFTRTSVGDHEPKTWFHRIPDVPVLYQNIFKCAVAYLIASLFTFNPYLSSFISDLTTYGDRERRPSPSGHMVATVAVYFNPAKSMGAMVEADLFCLMGVVFSGFLCLSSMGLFWWLEQKPGWEWLADFLVIALLGVGMSVVAWMKVWMANPSFNTACSMTAIIIFVVLVKEGGLQTLLQVSFIVVCGAITSNLVCYAIWPHSATTALQANMAKTLDSFSTLLNLLTNAFLLEEGLQQPSHERLLKAVANHQGSFTGLKKSLKEAQSEWVSGSQPRSRAYEDAVASMNRLAQHLNGLRGGTRLQYDLAKAGVLGGRKLDGNGKNRADASRGGEDETVMLEAAAEMFGELVEDVGPPLKELSTTCTSTLQRMRHSFIRSQRRSRRAAFHQHEFIELVDGIERALSQFENTSNHAVLRLYRRSALAEMPADLRYSSYSEDTEILSGSENEHVFLVYFFIFTLQEFAGELVSLVDAMRRIYALEQARTNRAGWWQRLLRRVSPWSRSHRKKNGNGASTSGASTPRPGKNQGPLGSAGIRRRFSQYMAPAHRRTHPMFPKVRPHAPNTIQTPAWERLSFTGRIKQRLWALGTRLAENDAKFAIKAGMATAVLAAPAFFDSTRHIFVGLWGDWALISFFIVISPTIGATNFLSLHRVFGTILGAGAAAAVYALIPDDPVLLTIFGFFFSIPCFYYIVAKPKYISAARFVLLTYNLTCLYCYNVRAKDVSPWDIALNRALSVTIGVVWAALVSRFWWPAEARKELTKGLGEFCLNIGWLYTRLVRSNSFAPLAEDDEDYIVGHDGDEQEDQGRDRRSDSIKDFMAMELHLQIKLIELQGLLAQTQHEPRLKGPFPVQLYRGILTSLQTILDRLHSMRCVTTREEWYTSVRQDFIIPVNKERREMVGNIILGFSTLASAFRLKAPLPPYLPPAEAARQRLVAAIRKLEVVRNREVRGSRQLLFFAYALTMKGVTVELENLGRTLQGAFGVIGQTPEEFEALFVDPHEDVRRIVEDSV
ncbi:ArAE-2 domain-containing protein [Mycena kentingensis (nom. inval.)]|nr:ArAE-2 domain-containing protein [Mycena kentingensis (nom. inval.)]